MHSATSEKERLARFLSAADKIPPFWIQDPELWFHHVETVFKRYNITRSLTKFQIIISKIQIDILVPARDIIKCPGDRPYEKIKSRLVTTYLESETKRIQKLLEGKHLSNKKPSQILALLIKLAGYVTASGVVKKLWMKLLPQNIQSILITTGLEDINKLAEFADKLQEALPSERIRVISKRSHSYPEEDYDIDERSAASLEAKIVDLSRQIALMSSEMKYNRNRNCNYKTGRGLQINNNSNCMCYYHFKFKEKARKCATPCSWVQTNYCTSYNELQEQPLW